MKLDLQTKILRLAFLLPFFLFIGCLVVAVLIGPARGVPNLNVSPTQFQTLEAANISSIMIDDHLITDPTVISDLVNTLHLAEPFKLESYYDKNGHRLFALAGICTITPRIGKICRFSIDKCLNTPSDAILCARIDRGIPINSYFFVKDLCTSFEKAGINLPTLFDKSSTNGSISPQRQAASLNKQQTGVLTLYNIERSIPLIYSSLLRNRIIFCTILGTVTLYLTLFSIYIVLSGNLYFLEDLKYRDSKSQANFFLGTALVFALVACFSAYVALDHNKIWMHYEQLKNALIAGRCQMIEGLVTKAEFNQVGHNPLNIIELDVDNHQFYFPQDYGIEGNIFNSNGWIAWAQQRLLTGTRVRIWYTQIPSWEIPKEHVARIDLI